MITLLEDMLILFSSFMFHSTYMCVNIYVAISFVTYFNHIVLSHISYPKIFLSLFSLDCASNVNLTYLVSRLCFVIKLIKFSLGYKNVYDTWIEISPLMLQVISQFMVFLVSLKHSTISCCYIDSTALIDW